MLGLSSAKFVFAVASQAYFYAVPALLVGYVISIPVINLIANQLG
jgi:hypothetical protein